ncbi:MAG TPA: hypothetical protein VFI90_19285 [Rubrobacter sp.]|nr:hypothetical protein [Rubrobacter sp.]
MLTDRRKIVAWLAWSLCLFCVGLCAPLLSLLNGRNLIEFFKERDGTVVVLVISFSVVGALIVSHRPENTVGWIFCTAALCQAFSEVELDNLTDDLVAVVRETVQPARMSLWLRPQGEDLERER